MTRGAGGAAPAERVQSLYAKASLRAPRESLARRATVSRPPRRARRGDIGIASAVALW